MPFFFGAFVFTFEAPVLLVFVAAAAAAEDGFGVAFVAYIAIVEATKHLLSIYTTGRWAGKYSVVPTFI